ncbi:TPA: hypothetical protein QCY27_001249 [Bacillus pacificus]|nr:hypothetical protein [Bacillus pacificus]UEP93617.1 hypothetical protein LMD38_20050 [Bacillus pacificus]HDR7894837.1 hypothetical protein [Bacillus pacificus]
MMTENEILIHLIRQTGYLTKYYIPYLYLGRQPELAKKLRELNYTYDDDGNEEFTDKGKELLGSFYQDNEERIIEKLRSFKSRYTGYFSFSYFCESLGYQSDCEVEYLLEKLKERKKLNYRWRENIEDIDEEEMIKILTIV